MKRIKQRWALLPTAVLISVMLTGGALAAEPVGYCTLDHDHGVHADCPLDHDHAYDGECAVSDSHCHRSSGHHRHGHRRACRG